VRGLEHVECLDTERDERDGGHDGEKPVHGYLGKVRKGGETVYRFVGLVSGNAQSTPVVTAALWLSPG
jgi:hypothetical protein